MECSVVKDEFTHRRRHILRFQNTYPYPTGASLRRGEALSLEDFLFGNLFFSSDERKHLEDDDETETAKLIRLS
ncbi:hypothetical protein TSMEX_008725 [Taenia solium]|eukprot:TsM_000987000 transcript=TsM_000987000 gene=TsM_000987000